MTNHAVLHLHLLLWLFAYCCCSSWALYEPPCQASLGLRSGVIDDGLLYDISVSTGRPQDVRLDAPKAWQPLISSPDNLIQVNMSRPVLLTGLQVQGNVGTDGWVSGWTLQTSLNCELFHSQDYELENENPYQSVMVPLKAMAFVSCLRIRPTGYHGAVPGMRLDLLGCVTSQSDHCQPHLSPTSELWLSGGGRELTYPHQLLLSWVRVSVKHKAESGTVGEVTLYHSRDCVSWEYYEPLDINVVSIN
ncbi:uncharacterized protein LOC101855286 [Aplysia californica]|uniref:Uncharacterized protein LOC101855286 n=1 Tax=Aplysia californica TaxID=6500 RepID=A0ABM1A848_APLCA|nr:uncharacterized protein LOC101855286 [Aplysia californica]